MFAAVPGEVETALAGVAPFRRSSAVFDSAVFGSTVIEPPAVSSDSFATPAACWLRRTTLTEPEIWHFYAGDPVHLHLIDEDGTLNTITLGSDLAAGQSVQHVIPAGVWQAAEIAPGGDWGLIGCTMAPGFTPSGFKIGRAHV